MLVGYSSDEGGSEGGEQIEVVRSRFSDDGGSPEQEQAEVEEGGSSDGALDTAFAEVARSRGSVAETRTETSPRVTAGSAEDASHTNVAYGAYPDTDAAYGAYPDTDAAYGAYPDTDSAYGAYPNTDDAYGPAANSDDDAEEFDAKEFAPSWQPPSWAKEPAKHPDVRLDVRLNQKMLGQLPLGSFAFCFVGRRGMGAQIEIDDSSVEAAHAVIINSASKTFVEDLGTVNGTFLDGKRLKPAEPVELDEGSELRFGECETSYHAAGIVCTPAKPPKWAPPDWASPSTRECRVEFGGQEFPLKDSVSFVIGRNGESSDIVVSFESASRQHAAIVHNGTETFVMDLGSTHGTFLNGVAIQPHQAVKVSSGELIGIGAADARMVFRVAPPGKKPGSGPTKRPREEASVPAAEGGTAVPYDPSAAIFKAMAHARSNAASAFSWNEVLARPR